MRRSAAALLLAMLLALGGCALSGGAEGPSEAQHGDVQHLESTELGSGQQEAKTRDEEAESMRLSIDGTDVSVEWEDNQAVAELAGLAADDPLTIQLSMYGGWEQVGPIGANLTSEDVQTTARPGDIMLYSGNQIVVFYGSNRWAYTPLGHICDRTDDEMAELLGTGDVSITISMG